MFKLICVLEFGFTVASGERMDEKVSLNARPHHSASPWCRRLITQKNVSSLCVLHRADALRRGRVLRLTFSSILSYVAPCNSALSWSHCLYVMCLWWTGYIHLSLVPVPQFESRLSHLPHSRAPVVAIHCIQLYVHNFHHDPHAGVSISMSPTWLCLNIVNSSLQQPLCAHAEYAYQSL